MEKQTLKIGERPPRKAVALPPAAGYRPGTYLDPTPLNVLFIEGGLGDYIAWMPAIFKLIERSPQIEPHFFVPRWFIPLFRNFLASRKIRPKNLKLRPREEITEDDLKVRWTIDPRLCSNHSINACGLHLNECGHVYFNRQLDYEGEYVRYPKFRHRDPEVPGLPKELLRLRRTGGKYFVLTPCSTTETRTLPRHVHQGIADFLLNQGHEVVLLGDTKFRSREPIRDNSPELRPGIHNFVGRTDLALAAHIIASAEGIIGLDNGLLHLAATTNVPHIFFAYNIASPFLREPTPAYGNTRVHNILPENPPHCLFCQDNMRHFPATHSFSKCLYGDTKCLDGLTSQRFIDAITKTQA